MFFYKYYINSYLTSYFQKTVQKNFNDKINFNDKKTGGNYMLKNKNIRSLYLGRLISSSGDNLYQVAII